VVMHIPSLCEQKKIPLVFVPAKLDLGKAVGLGVPCAAASIEKAGEGQPQLKEVVGWSAERMGGGKSEMKREKEPKEERRAKKQ